jgi:hypothetical protein
MTVQALTTSGETMGWAYCGLVLLRLPRERVNEACVWYGMAATPRNGAAYSEEDNP